MKHRRYNRARSLDDNVPPPPRMYQAVWEHIAQNTSDVPVKVRCPPQNQGRLIRAIRKEKTAANTLRKRLDAPSYGELVVKQDGDVVWFSLKYNGDLL